MFTCCTCDVLWCFFTWYIIMFYNIFCDVHVVYMWCFMLFFVMFMYHTFDVLCFFTFTCSTCDVLWYFLCSRDMHVIFYDAFLRCSRTIYVMFYDVFNDVHLIYMWCFIMYLVMFYDEFSVVHLVCMWYYIVYFKIFEEYPCDILFNFSLLYFLFFSYAVL
jgi:hypothetical protein